MRNTHRWEVCITLHNAPSFSMVCPSEKHAEEQIELWRSSVKAGETFVEFVGSFGRKNLTLVSAIVSMFVLDNDQQRALITGFMRDKKRIEKELEYGGESDDPDDYDSKE